MPLNPSKNVKPIEGNISPVDLASQGDRNQPVKPLKPAKHRLSKLQKRGCNGTAKLDEINYRKLVKNFPY